LGETAYPFELKNHYLEYSISRCRTQSCEFPPDYDPKCTWGARKWTEITVPDVHWLQISPWSL